MTVSISRTEKTISVNAEYNSVFVPLARNLGGKFTSGNWMFDIRDEASVLEACYRCYGDDGIRKNQCDVRISVQDRPEMGQHNAPIAVFGKTIARAYNRDSGAKITTGVVIESGGFDSGGSMKNWRTICKENTVFIVRDVSRVLVDEHDQTDVFTVEILASQKPVSKADLLKEKASLEARLAEINQKLGGL